MGPDAANLAGSIAKSLDVDRSPRSTQRASEIAQEQDAQRYVSAVREIRPEGADSMRRARLKHEREQKRREIERRQQSDQDAESDGSEGERGLDVMV